MSDEYEGNLLTSEALTLRDYFAAKAMPMIATLHAQGLHGKKADQDARQFISEEAYMLADAMLKERAK